MTSEEKQEIINAVLAAIRTNSQTIDQLTSVSEMSDTDFLELNGGRKVSYGVLFANHMSNDDAQEAWEYLDENKVDKDSRGLVEVHQAPVVFLDAMGELDGHALTGNDGLEYRPSSKLIYDFPGGLFGAPKAGAVYISKNNLKKFVWNGTDLEELKVDECPLFVDYSEPVSFATLPVGGSYYVPSSHKIAVKIDSSNTKTYDPLSDALYFFRDKGKVYTWNSSNQTWVSLTPRVINDLTTGGEGDALSAEMGIILRGAIETLLSNLGDYAFPNGKPNISWVGSPFTITQNLTRVTSDCDYGTIYSGSQLTIHLSADVGCTLSAVTVKMRGVDVTNDYYDATTGTIDIPSVTGDIVITAVAVYPFDAEIEFLQSSGTQWLDTGIVAGVGFRCEIKADVQAADTGWHRLLGARDANANFAIPVGIKPTSVDGKLYTQFGVAATNAIVASAVSVAGLHTFITQLSSDTLSFSVDGSVNSVQFSSIASVLPSLSLYMFSNHREDSTVESISAKVYYCKIWNGETLLRDFIPVRVGQVGQMFDRVSGQFFTNIGTGSFTLGNDITE